MFEPASGANEAKLEGHSGPVKALAVLTNGGRLASLFFLPRHESPIKLWDTAKGAFISTIGHSFGPSWALAVLPDERLAIGNRIHSGVGTSRRANARLIAHP